MTYYAPHRSKSLDPKIVGVLTDSWQSFADICRALRVADCDSKVLYRVRQLRETGAIDHKAEPNIRHGKTFFYRRKMEEHHGTRQTDGRD